MTRSAALDVTIAVAAAGTAGLLVLLDDEAGAGELLWAVILLECLVAVVLLVRAAARRERLDRSAAEAVVTTTADEAARRAVVQERVLLAADIEAVVRASTRRMATRAERAEHRWDDDPLHDLRGVQEEGRRATAELRRMLGLLRDATQDATADPDVSAARDAKAGTARRPLVAGSLSRTDVVLGAATAALALGELASWSDHAVEGPSGAATATARVLTLVAAGSLVLRGAAPGAGAAVCGVVFLLGALAGRPVSGGLWMLATLGALAWTAASRRTATGLAGLITLGAGVAVAQSWRDPDNLAIALVICMVPALGGALAGWRSARGQAARRRAATHSAQLAEAAEAAVRAERLAVARDLHDVVSHAVGVMVMQAGAAEALWPVDPARARQALDVVRQTAAESLHELDRLVLVIGEGAMGAPVTTTGAVERDAADVEALVARMRSAGLAITLSVSGTPYGDTGRAVYRIVQEALTNTLRHAPGAHVTVSVTSGAGGTEVVVDDDGPGPRDEAYRGYGLVGIAERVERLGGELSAGAGPQGRGFRVHARIPLVVEAVP